MKSLSSRVLWILPVLLLTVAAGCGSSDSSTSTDAASGDADDSEAAESDSAASGEAEIGAEDSEAATDAAQKLECFRANLTTPYLTGTERAAAEKACTDRKLPDGTGCRVRNMGLGDSVGQEYSAFICQTPDECGSGALVTTFWLGPAYGCAQSSSTMGFPGWIYYNVGQFNHCPTWTTEGLDDALAADVSDVPCEQITDYRACVRSVLPPNTYCTPIIQTDDDDNPVETSSFTGCKGVVDECRLQ